MQFLHILHEFVCNGKLGAHIRRHNIRIEIAQNNTRAFRFWDPLILTSAASFVQPNHERKTCFVCGRLDLVQSFRGGNRRCIHVSYRPKCVLAHWRRRRKRPAGCSAFSEVRHGPDFLSHFLQFSQPSLKSNNEHTKISCSDILFRRSSKVVVSRGVGFLGHLCLFLVIKVDRRYQMLDYYPNSRSTRKYRQLVALQYGVQDNKELCMRLTLHQIFTENSTSRGGPYLYTATQFIDRSVCLF
jgi:hypothetical protein